MPMYEYLCHGCGKRFEVRQNFSDDPLTRHEECSGDVERLISVPSLQFKGSGWYVTDYAKGGSGGANAPSGSGNDAAAKSDKSDGGSSSSSTPSESKSSSPAPAPSTSSSDSKS